MPDLQKTENTDIFLNDRVLAMGCPISTLETLIMVFTDMNKIWMNQVYRSHIRSWIEFCVYKSISYAQGILKDSLLFFLFFFFLLLVDSQWTPPLHHPIPPFTLYISFPLKNPKIKEPVEVNLRLVSPFLAWCPAFKATLSCLTFQCQ